MPAPPGDGHGAARWGRGRGRAGASPGKGRLQPRGGGRAGRGSRARRGRCLPRGGRGVPAPPAASPLSGGGARTPERAGVERAFVCAGSGGEPAMGCGALLPPARSTPASAKSAACVRCRSLWDGGGFIGVVSWKGKRRTFISLPESAGRRASSRCFGPLSSEPPMARPDARLCAQQDAWGWSSAPAPIAAHGGGQHSGRCPCFTSEPLGLHRALCPSAAGSNSG